MDDTIYRQDAVREIANHLGIPAENWMKIAEEWLRDVPSVQPERKGRWIKLDMHAHLADHKCTACGQECYVPTCMGEPMYTYCPNCGADMRGGENG